MCVLFPRWTVCSPRKEICQPLCYFVSLFGIQYRPGYNNRRLISGPRTRVFVARQEVLSMVPGAVPTIFQLPLVSEILCCVHLWVAPGERPVCVAMVLPVRHFSSHSVLLWPALSLPPHTHSLRHAAQPALAKNKSSWLHSNEFGFLYSSFSSSHNSASALNLR